MRNVVIGVLVGILAFWAATVPVLAWLVPGDTVTGDAIAKRGQIGDAFGSINALFSGLALAGIIVAILLQREELRLQRRELEETRAELRRQADASEKQEAALRAQHRIGLLQAVINGRASLYEGGIADRAASATATRADKIPYRALRRIGGRASEEALRRLLEQAEGEMGIRESDSGSDQATPTAQ